MGSRTKSLTPADGFPEREIRFVTMWGMAGNLSLSFLKFVAGVLGNSQALVADAAHSLSDMASDVVVLIGVRFWLAPADACHPYGHRRMETMASFLIGLLVGAVGIGLGVRAIVELHVGEGTVPGWIAFAVACISMLAKEALYRWHLAVGRRLRSSAMIANAWHHRSDALSSLPVAVAVLGVRFMPTWGFLDHVAAALVSVLVVKAAWDVAWPSYRELVDAGVERAERQQWLAVVQATPGVYQVHALRSRRVGPGWQVDLHIEVAPDLTVRQGHDIAGAAQKRLLGRAPEVMDVLVHVEPHGDGDGSTAGSAQ